MRKYFKIMLCLMMMLSTLCVSMLNASAVENYTRYYTLDGNETSYNDGGQKLIFVEGSTLKLTLKSGVGEAASNVSWESKYESVATIDNVGNITFINSGLGEFTGTVDSEVYTYKVQLLDANDTLLSINMNSSKLNNLSNSTVITDDKVRYDVNATDTFKLSVFTPIISDGIVSQGKKLYKDLTEVVFSSTNSDVATITSGGKLQTLKTGTTTIKATYKGTDYNATIYVGDSSVLEARFVIQEQFYNSDIINTKQSTFMVGDKHVLDIDKYEFNGYLYTPKPAVTDWQSSNPSVASIDSTTGAFEALSAGKTTISAQCDGKKESIEITVRPKKADGVYLKNNSITLSLMVGDEIDIISFKNEISELVGNSYVDFAIQLSDADQKEFNAKYLSGVKGITHDFSDFYIRENILGDKTFKTKLSFVPTDENSPERNNYSSDYEKLKQDYEDIHGTNFNEYTLEEMNDYLTLQGKAKEKYYDALTPYNIYVGDSTTPVQSVDLTINITASNEQNFMKQVDDILTRKDSMTSQDELMVGKLYFYLAGYEENIKLSFSSEQLDKIGELFKECGYINVDNSMEKLKNVSVEGLYTSILGDAEKSKQDVENVVNVSNQSIRFISQEETDSDSIEQLTKYAKDQKGNIVANYNFGIEVAPEGSDEYSLVSTIDNPITISIDSSDIEDYDSSKETIVVRKHGDELEELDTTVVDGIIKVETDKFSSYSIMQVEKATAPGDGQKPTTGDNGIIINTDNKANKTETTNLSKKVSTGDNTNIYGFVVMFMISIAGGFIVLKKKLF